MEPEKLPFQKYIIEANKNMNFPAYLSNNTVYKIDLNFTP